MVTDLRDPKSTVSSHDFSMPISVADEVAQFIRGQICKGILRPGDRLIELKIGKELGVAQNVVREALIKLDHWGYVQRFPRKGTYVISLSRNEVIKLFEVRTPWEILAVELILKRWKTEELDFAQAERALAEMHNALGRADFLNLYDSDLQFHRSLWQLANNRYLFQALERVTIPVFGFFAIKKMTSIQDLAWHEWVLSNHDSLLEAVKGRSLAKARAALLQAKQDALKYGSYWGDERKIVKVA